MTDKKFYAEDSARFAAAIEKLKVKKLPCLVTSVLMETALAPLSPLFAY